MLAIVTQLIRYDDAIVPSNPVFVKQRSKPTGEQHPKRLLDRLDHVRGTAFLGLLSARSEKAATDNDSDLGRCNTAKRGKRR